MPDTDSSTELALQICFGVFGVFSTVATLAGLHHHDSLGCVLIRRLRGRRVTSHHDLDVDAANTSLDDLDVTLANAIQLEQRPTLPPSYEQTGKDSRLETFLNSNVDGGPSNSKSNAK